MQSVIFINIERMGVGRDAAVRNINVTADTVDGTTSGWELAPNSFLNFDITDDVIIYAITPIGQTAKVKILEMS